MQPDLSNYYGSLQPDHSYKLEAQVAIWFKIGSGSFSALSPTNLNFTGNYDVLGHEGDVTLAVTVTGTNVGTVNVNGQSGPCTFQEDGDNLIATSQGKTFKLHVMGGGIWIGGDVPWVNALWIGQ